MPVMRISKIGYGMGSKDFDATNCVRIMLGETEDENESVLELKCNIDDMAAEEIGYAAEQLRKSGALDVFTAPIGMKKNRPGTLLCCICKISDKERLINAIFRYTSTIGIRQNICARYVLNRTENKVKTKYGDVRVKRSEGYGVKRIKTEYDDIARIELLPEDFEKLLKIREEVYSSIKALGFSYVTMDLKDYRTGSMNEGIVNGK